MTNPEGPWFSERPGRDDLKYARRDTPATRRQGVNPIPPTAKKRRILLSALFVTMGVVYASAFILSLDSGSWKINSSIFVCVLTACETAALLFSWFVGACLNLGRRFANSPEASTSATEKLPASHLVVSLTVALALVSIISASLLGYVAGLDVFHIGAIF